MDKKTKINTKETKCIQYKNGVVDSFACIVLPSSHSQPSRYVINQP